MGFGGQGRDATFLPRTFPTLHAGKTCTDESGNFCERLPFLEILRSATTTSFQFRHTAFGSHKLSYGASSTVGSITAQFSLNGENSWYRGVWLVEGDAIYGTDCSQLETVSADKNSKAIVIRL